MSEKTLETVMEIIVHSGEAKSLAMEALQAAKKQDFELAEQKIQASKDALIVAHKAQTKMLTQEAQGETVEMSLILVHSQDHLMTSITFKDLVIEFIEVYRQLANASKE